MLNAMATNKLKLYRNTPKRGDYSPLITTPTRESVTIPDKSSRKRIHEPMGKPSKIEGVRITKRASIERHLHID